MTINPSPKYSGEPSAQALAGGLATLGRYGDSYMVHAAEGETMIPKEVFDENPNLKQELVFQMKMMGIKDPDRYVVGNTLNSINPITGQPEFWYKRVKRFVKKVFNKVAPIVAPIIGNMIAPGIGGIVASGFVTKLQGGTWGDAGRAMALSYGAQAATAGIGGALQGTRIGDFIGAGTPAVGSTFGGRFMTGLGTGLTAPFSAAANLISPGAQNPLAQGIFGPRTLGTSGIFSSLAGTKANPSAFAQSGQKGFMGTVFPSYQTGTQLTQAGINPGSGSITQSADAARFAPGAVRSQPLGPPSSQIDREIAFELSSLGKGESFNPEAYRIARNRGLDELASLNIQSTPGATAALAAPPAATPAAAAATTAAATAGAAPAAAKPNTLLGSETLAKVAGQAIVPVGLAGAAYLLTEEEKTVEEYLKSNPMDPQRAAYDQWSAIDDKSSEEAQALKNQWYGGRSRYSAAELESKFGANPIAGITSPGPTAANAGNLSGSPLISNLPNIQGVGGLLINNNALPLARAYGGEVMGPGTGTSDSIPARLSDGEFVMTAQAVRNAGNGNRDVGAARMYDMMNRFERGAA